jgi:glutamine synthetase
MATKSKPAKVTRRIASNNQADSVKRVLSLIKEKGDVFTPDVIETWVEMRRTKDLPAVNLRPHPYEFFLYYDT